MCIENEHIYDGFEHLRRALFWEPDAPIVMLTFYADDANKRHQHDYIHVAGWVGLAAQWDTFSIDWRLRLAKAGLTKFHASEFFTGNDQFAGWNSKEREGERKNLLRDLIQIVDHGALYSFICIVHVPGWRVVNQEYCLEERYLRPYPLAGRTIVKMARNWWDRRGNKADEIKYVFDRDFEDWGMLCDRLKLDLGILPVPADSSNVRPIQAADWLAYESSKEAPQYDDWENRKRPPRASFLALMDLGKTEPAIFHEKDIRKLCEDPRAAIPKRQGG